MGLIASDFKNQLFALLPFGAAWRTDYNTTLSKQLDAWSQELYRVQSRSDVLGNEADPRLTNELLTDYERIFGLPTDCLTGVTQTIEQRHSALVAQMTTVGNQTKQSYINLAARSGYTVTITEYRPWDVGMTIDIPIYGPDWAYAFSVTAPLNTATFFRVNSGVNEALQSWSNVALECLINRFKPAHTIAIFNYV
jgi:uncharacterized protein YmfQ (DUF2313 family)